MVAFLESGIGSGAGLGRLKFWKTKRAAMDRIGHWDGALGWIWHIHSLVVFVWYLS